MAATCYPETQKLIQDELDSVVGRCRRELRFSIKASLPEPSLSTRLRRPRFPSADYGICGRVVPLEASNFGRLPASGDKGYRLGEHLVYAPPVFEGFVDIDGP